MLLRASVRLDEHEFGPRFPVVRPFASPREVFVGNVCISGAGVCVRSHRLFEHIHDRLIIEPGAPELLRPEVHPRSGECIQPFHVPPVLAGVVGADV